MKFFYSVFFVLINVAVVGQQTPHYTQYILNNYALNPALSGIENYTDIKLSMRNQWAGFEGAPKTFYATIHGPIGKKDLKTTPTSFAMPGENPRGNAYWQSYEASAPHHGLGLKILNDATGNFNRFSISASYAYHLGLNEATNLAMGFSAGLKTITLNAGGKAFFGNNPSDPAVGGVLASELKKIKPDLSVGLWLYSSNYFFGVSLLQVIPQEISFVADHDTISGGRLVRHNFFTGGVRFLAGEDFNFLPSVMVKYIRGEFRNNYQAEFNLKCQYRDQLWLGGSYRQFDGFAAMLGANLSNLFQLSYSYDFTQTQIRTFSRGTHEFVIGFIIGNKYGDTCPRNVW